jgi:RNA polymerase sigma-70 factor, ECF subfamily
LDNPDSITEWLMQARQGDSIATGKLWESVYGEVRQLARQALAREFAQVSIASTELAHEVYVRLAGKDALSFESRAHLLATVARAIRRVLIDRARAKLADKRGGHAQRVPLDEAVISLSVDDPELLDLDAALVALEQHNPQHARLVELRFFGGLTLDEAADVMGISRRSVANHWALARAWLRRKLGE